MYDWRQQGLFYNQIGPALRAEFGTSVRKVSVDAGMSCPHKKSGGCVFCDDSSFSPAKRLGLNEKMSITEQIDEGVNRLRKFDPQPKVIVYFQPSTNTFGSVDFLESTFRLAIDHPNVIGIAIGTRPDCLPNDVLDLLVKLSNEKWLSLEIGLQSVHDKSLEFLNRGHNYACFVDAATRAQLRNLRLCVHLILGIPSETAEDMNETAERIAEFSFHSIKLHNLYVVKNTKLADLWQSGKISLPGCEEYVKYVANFLERTPPETIIERISAESRNEFLLAPDWTADKHIARNALDREFRLRKTFQGVYAQQRQ